MNQPGPEARIANLEKETMSLGARIEEAASDTAEDLRSVRQDISANFEETKQNDRRLFDHVQKGFEQAVAFIQENTASKEDIKTLEQRITGEINTLKTTQNEQSAKLDQILTLLQQKPGP